MSEPIEEKTFEDVIYKFIESAWCNIKHEVGAIKVKLI